MSTRQTGRHRAPARSASQVLGAPSGGTVAKTSAVLAVSSGLVASLGLQAQAAPPSVVDTSASADASTGLQQAAPARAAFVSGVAAAPSFGEIGFTAKAKPQVKPAVISPARRALTSHVSRSTARTALATNDTPSTIEAGDPGSDEFGATVLGIAARYAGIAYQYGGTTPSGFDCSGYVQYVMRQVGISLPRTSSAQRGATKRISRSEAVPGDLVFMPGHVGIYAGNGMMWDSPRTGQSISKRAVYSSSATYGRVG